MVTVEKVTESSVLAEGPHWDDSTQSLFYIDLFGKKILKYDPATEQVTQVPTEKKPSFIIPVDGSKDQFVISQDNELVVISWDGESDDFEIVETLATIDSPEDTPLIFNDAKCDSTGRLLAGIHGIALETFSETKPIGTLYTLDANRQLTARVQGIRCTNGIAFNEAAKKVFYIDSLIDTIDRFDYDIVTGALSNREPWFTLKKHGVDGVADGMTIDTDGNLWVAVFGAGRVVNVDGETPETLIQEIKIPAQQTTSVSWGGENLDELFVTTGDVEIDGGRPTSADNGSVYKVTGTGARGLPANNFKLK